MQDIINLIENVETLCETWKEAVRANEKPLDRFFRKGFERPGREVRRELKEVIQAIEFTRKDILAETNRRRILKDASS